MRQFCEYCNYETYDLSHFNRHKKSQRHQKNMINKASKEHIKKQEENTKRTQKEQNKSNLSCKFCNRLFTTKTSKYRHQLHFCKISKEKKQESSEINELKQKLKKISQSIHNFKPLKSMSALNYANTYLSDSPPIESLSGKQLDGFIVYKSKTNKSIEEVIIHYYEKNKLDQFLGNLIVDEYKKDNIKDQSFFTSDVSRLTFIIKQTIGIIKKSNDEIKSKWIVDKHGLDIIKLIIEPITNKVKDKMQKYVKKCNEHIQNEGYNESKDNYHFEQILKLMEKATSIIMFANLKQLNAEVLKYIAPYFNLNVNNQENIFSETKLIEKS